jgi:hypothetical protein
MIKKIKCMNRFSFKVAMPVLLGLMVVSLGLPSCEKTDDDSGNGSESFWDKSDAFKRQLKGKVHTMYDGNTYTFDESGWLVKIEGLNEQTFQYTNGRLSTYQEKNTYNGQQTIYISRYTYGNHGKYIPQNLYYDLSENRLMKDLVKIETENGSTSYVLKGDSILCINESTYDGQTEKDTSVIYYDGGRYPVRMHYFHMYRTITYAQDGKFLTVVQGHFPSPRMNTVGLFSTETTVRIYCRVVKSIRIFIMEKKRTLMSVPIRIIATMI